MTLFRARWLPSALLLFFVLTRVDSHLPPQSLTRRAARGANLPISSIGARSNAVHKKRTLNFHHDLTIEKSAITVNTAGFETDGDDLKKGALDMELLVNFLVQNWRVIPSSIFNLYFAPTSNGKVSQISQTVNQMAKSDGDTSGNPLFQPFDLSKITLARHPGLAPNLSDATNLTPQSTNPSIYITDFGWQVLYKRTLEEFTCNMLAPKLNYKFQFLGGVILSDVL